MLGVGRCHRWEGERGRESEGEGEGELCIEGEDNSDVNNDSIVYSDRLSSRGNLIL